MEEILIKIGIHGPRNSGKTCFLASLYGKRSDGECAIAFDDNDSIENLKNLWDKLEIGIRPEATVNETEYSFTFTNKVNTCRIHIHDYAGALIQRTTGEADQLKSDVKQWINQCDAIVIFVDVDQVLNRPGPELLERENEINLFINDLQDKRKKRLLKPIVVALTKWDVYSSSLENKEEEEERVLEFLTQHPTLNDIVNSVRNFSSDFQIIPFSSFGSNESGNLPPEGGPKPFNTFRPFEWCVSRVSEIRAKKRKFRNYAIKIAFIIIIISSGFFLEYSSKSNYLSLKQNLESGNKSVQKIRSQYNNFLSSSNPFSSLMKRKHDIMILMQDISKKQLSNDYERLKPIHGNEDTKELDEKINRFDSFIMKWDSLTPIAQELKEINEWKAKAEGLQSELKKDDGLKDQIAILIRSLDEENDLHEKHEMIKNFLNEHPSSKYPERCKFLFDELNNKRLTLLNAMQNQEWNEILSFLKDHANDYSLCMRKLDNFILEHNNKALRTDAEIQRKRIESEWDRNNYSNLKRIVNAVSTYNDLVKVKGQLEEYVNSSRPQPRMKDSVKNWLKAFDDIKQNGIKCWADIQNVIIEKGGPLKAGENWSFSVEISKGEDTFATEYTKGFEPSFKTNNLGPFWYKPGDLYDITLYRQGGILRLGLDRSVSKEIEPFIQDIILEQNGNLAARIFLVFVNDKNIRLLPKLEDYRDFSDGGF